MQVALCPHCGGQIGVDPAYAGQAMQCPHCHQQFILPSQAAASPAPARAAPAPARSPSFPVQSHAPQGGGYGGQHEEDEEDTGGGIPTGLIIGIVVLVLGVPLLGIGAVFLLSYNTAKSIQVEAGLREDPNDPDRETKKAAADMARQALPQYDFGKPKGRMEVHRAGGDLWTVTGTATRKGKSTDFEFTFQLTKTRNMQHWGVVEAYADGEELYKKNKTPKIGG